MRNFYFPLVISFLLLNTSFAQSPQYKNLVLEGAGIRGFAYTGAFEVLDSLQVLKNIERVGGTSAGAIQAMLLAVGYSPREIVDIAGHVPLKKFNDGGWFFAGGIKRLKKEFGWYKGDKVQQWLHQLIEAKTGNGDITFGELHAGKPLKNYKDLFITGTDITYQCLRVFSYEQYPAMKIKDAVRISMSIPFYYKAVLIDDSGKVYKQPPANKTLHVMVDGGLLSNYPLFLFDSSRYMTSETAPNRCMENPETLGIIMELPEQMVYNEKQKGNYPIPVSTMNDYIKAIYHTLIDKANPEATNGSSLKRTITISNLNLSPRVRKLPGETIGALLDSGREGARQFFRKQ